MFWAHFCMVLWRRMFIWDKSFCVSTDLLSSYVCKLDKSLYVLKQAPRAWYSQQVIRFNGLDSNHLKVAPPFFFKRGDVITYSLVYVHDVIVVGSCDKEVEAVLYERDFVTLVLKVSVLFIFSRNWSVREHTRLNCYSHSQIKYAEELVLYTRINIARLFIPLCPPYKNFHWGQAHIGIVLQMISCSTILL